MLETAMPLDIKICGLKTPEAVDAAINGGATHLGFIFFEKSPRYVEPEIAGGLAKAARGRAKTVAVTVDAEDDFIDRIVSAMQPDMLQLHGAESPARITGLKQRHGLPVMKALSIRSADDLEAASAYEGVADMLLFDAKPPRGSELPGGNGVSFDWSLLTRLDRAPRYMLSGGITIGNVDEALEVVRPAGLDISSGVESAPGVKDIAKISEFLTHVSKTTMAGAA